MGEIKEVKVPDIGDFETVDIVEVLVAAGDSVAAEDSLVTLESEKATMDVPAPFAGTVREVKVKAGDKVSMDHVLALVEVEEQAPAAASAPAEAPPEEGPSAGAGPVQETAAAPTQTPAQPPAAEKADRGGAAPAPTAAPARPAPEAPPATSEGARAHASPGVRRLARELGADLSQVVGTGRKGRISQDDVKAFVKSRLEKPQAAAGGLSLPEMPDIDFSKFGEVEEQPLHTIRKRSAENLHRSWLHVPHVTQFDEADITELEAFRKELGKEAPEGVRVTLLSFVMKACVAALKRFPEVNSSLSSDGQSLILKRYYHLGIAVDTDYGLLVPVIRDVDQKGILDLAQELAEVSERARERKLRPQDLQGASFTISNLGGIGGTAFTPIVNAPEVAILGLSRGKRTPVWQGDGFVPRLLLPLSLSYDHRVVDGALAARFITHLKTLVSDVRRLLL